MNDDSIVTARDQIIRSSFNRSSVRAVRLLAAIGNGACIRRVDWSRKLIPDFHLVAIRIAEEHVGLPRNEFATIAHFAARCANGCQSPFDVCSSLQPEAEVRHSARLAGVPRLALEN